MTRHRTRTGRFAVIALVGIAGSACAPRQEAPPGPVAEDAQALVGRGAEVYGYSCGRCHNPRAAIERTDRSWETIIDHMRVRANLTGGEARAVTAFMRALNLAPEQRVVFDTVFVVDSVAARREPRPEVPGGADAVRRGGELVAAKGCAGCHIVAGRGGVVGPSLDAVFVRRDSVYVRRKLRDPRFDNPSSVMPEFGLTDAEVDAIIAYLQSLAR